MIRGFHLALPLSASDFAHLGPSTPMRSIGRSELAMSALDLLHLGLSMLMQTPCHTGSALLVFGKFSFGASSISVLGKVFFGSSLFVHSFAHLESCPLVFDFLHLDSSVFLRSLSHVSSPLFVCGSVCLGFFLPVSDSVQLDFFSPLRSFVYPSSFALALDLLRLGSQLFLRSSAHLNPSASVSGLLRLDFLLFILATASLGFILFIQSFLWPGPTLLAMDAPCTASSLFLHNFMRLGFVAFLIGLVCMEFLAPLLDCNTLESSILLRSSA